MYNLLIGLTRGKVSTDRLLEHTTDSVRQYICGPTIPGDNHGEVLTERLLNLPTLLMPETGSGHEPQIARVGHVTNLIKKNDGYAFNFVANSTIEPIPSAHIESASIELGITKWEFHRTHWAVKDIDLYRVLCEHVTTAGPKPRIFQFPIEEPLDPKLVAVMMPFNPGFIPVLDSLRAGIQEAGMHCLCADDIWERDHILDDVLNLIWRARVVVADLSGKNPNVFYETGIAHTLGRDTILVTQSIDDVPFDLRAIRTLTYLNNGEGRNALADGITNRLRTIIAS